MNLTDTATERRRLTRNKIFKYIYESDSPKTKQSIAVDLSLSMPTVHQNLTELFDAGLICYSGVQPSTGGRRAKGIVINQGVRFSVGISINEKNLSFVAADLLLQEIAYKKTAKFIISEIEDFGLYIANSLEEFLDENKLDRKLLLGVGIAIPAIINISKQEIVMAPTLDLRSTSLKFLTQHIPYNVFIENDATSAGFAEWFARHANGNMAYISLENGVGGALFVNGVPYFGDNHRSAEFGHICIVPDGLRCKCGKQGCFEAYCSSKRISDDLGITVDEFFNAVADGNERYQHLLNDVLKHLSVAVNNIRMSMDCDIVIGGAMSQYLQPYIPQLQNFVAFNNIFETNADFVQLSHYPRRAVPLGVALHFIKNFIESI
jgi:predicted NBD/HSP70 family sugar kinase